MRSGAPIYHTNVLMSVGTRFAAICAECIAQDAPAPCWTCCAPGGRTVVELSMEQMHAFAGNMLELRIAHRRAVIAMSRRPIVADSRRNCDALQAAGGPIVAAQFPPSNASAAAACAACLRKFICRRLRDAHVCVTTFLHLNTRQSHPDNARTRRQNPAGLSARLTDRQPDRRPAARRRGYSHAWAAAMPAAPMHCARRVTGLRSGSC